MARNPTHSMLSPSYHDEKQQQQFVYALKRHIGAKIRPGNRKLYDARAKPAFVNEHGHSPDTPNEVAEVMWRQPGYQLFSAIKRSAQKIMWESWALMRGAQLATAVAKRSSSPTLTATYSSSMEHMNEPQHSKS